MLSEPIKDALHWGYYQAPAQLRHMASNLLFKDGGTTESPNYNTARLHTVPIMQMVERIRARRPEEIPTGRYPQNTWGVWSGSAPRYLDNGGGSGMTSNGGYVTSLALVIQAGSPCTPAWR